MSKSIPMEVQPMQDPLVTSKNRPTHYKKTIFAHGQPSAFIIHGHGTGALKAAVRQYLADSPYARHFRSGLPQEGGDGVTVVAMR